MLRPAVLSLALVLAVILGAVIGSRALAQSAPDPSPALLCRHFKVDPARENGDAFDTSDGTREIGQWVREQQTLGWQVQSSDFEMGSNQNGYLVAYTQICLTRSR